MGMSYSYGNLGQYENALNASKQVVQLSPQEPGGYINLSFSYERLERHQEAVNAAQQAVRLAPGMALAYNNIAYGLNQLGRHQEAAQAALEALRVRKEARDDGLAYYNLGNAYSELKQPAKALNAFRQALQAYKLVPKLNADEYFYLGNAQLQVGQDELAVGSFREALRLRPSFAQPYFSLGLALFIKGNRRGAMDTYRSLKSIDPAKAAELYKVISAK
jgi:tetratricopeptide (TPR) repeat protein